jgi:1-acyl-sn-glycerol-3-phosphate acyltransferase
MGLIIRFFRLLYVVYAVVLFVAVMLLIFPFVFIGSFFGRIKGGNAIIRLCMLWADIWFFLVGIRHRNYYEVHHNPTKSYIFVSNHISFLDAALLVKTFRQPFRALGKVEMTKVPVFGYIYKKAIVTVDRTCVEDRAKSLVILRSIINKGISIMVFPEGTFNMTSEPLKEFYGGAFKVALETQTPIKPVLFLDAYDRMHYGSLFSLRPGKNRSVYLEEIEVDEFLPNDVRGLKAKVFGVMDQKLREYNATWIKSEGKS